MHMETLPLVDFFIKTSTGISGFRLSKNTLNKKSCLHNLICGNNHFITVSENANWT